MLPPLSLRRLLILGFLTLPLLLGQFGRADGPKEAVKTSTVDFNRHIRPILSENCFACHGPDEKSRKAKLRLDTKEGAFARLSDGSLTIAPGKSAASELFHRISSKEMSQVMPPTKTGKKLTAEQIALLKRWIDEGAEWSSHWAFVTPRKSQPPAVSRTGWVRNAVDHFILSRLDKEGLEPSSEADRAILLRRVTLDLTGLPPTLAETDAFLADSSPQAYEKVVDRLLQSPRYGEHMARFWLDAARYGDTHGMHLDNYREIWPYRDWVIRAFNKNMPFDRFLTEQLAGDMLPNATLEQKVATGFIRCHVTTNEGGSIDEEVYVRNVVDRVDTNGTVLLGLTIGCARCHDHRYDPVSTKDYYQMFAFFNNIDGSSMDGNAAQHPPIVRMPTPEQAAEQEQIQKRTAEVNKKVAEVLATVKYEEPAETKPVAIKHEDFVWLDDQLPSGSKALPKAGPNVPWVFAAAPEPVFAGQKSVKLVAKGIQQAVFTDASPGLSVGEGDRLFAYVRIDPTNPPKTIMLQWHSTAWLHRAYWGDNAIPWGADNSGERRAMGPLPKAGEWVRLEVVANQLGIKPGTILNGFAFTQLDGVAHWDKAGLVTRTPQGPGTASTFAGWLKVERGTGGAKLPKDLQPIVKLDPAKHTAEQKTQLRNYFLQHVNAETKKLFTPLNEELAKLNSQRDRIDKAIPSTLVFKERNDVRPAYILKRGEYDQRGEQVGRSIPPFLPPLPEKAPRNRLGFAQWLTTPEHPLTARVAVNRLWQQCFGTGIVKTAEDFGSQGEQPSHPELLDWLAVQFMEDGWDVKKLMHRLVTSATYRQSARITKDRLARDPHNRLLSRGPRFRLDAEMLRDQALFVSGLLVEKVGGPSVKPPQPAGLWEAVAFTGSNTGKFSADTGHEKVHRRSMYIFWKRTAAPPQMNAFDAPSRESCTVRRERTNTPLQALLLMNEQQFVEAARVLGERTMKEGGTTLDDKLRYLFRSVATRAPETAESVELRSLYEEQLKIFQGNTKAAQQLLQVGETRPDASLNTAELATWTVLANLVLNLDEVISR